MLRNLLLTLSLGAAVAVMGAEEKLIIVDEGTWQTDNGRLSYFADGKMVSNEWFRETNGKKLGDTPADIIQVKENLIAIAVRNSNLVQLIDNDGKAVGEVDELPNLRCLATDGRYLYVTSYAHECQTTSGLKTFTKGFVAKIDPETLSIIDAVETGYEPEGIAFYDGHLFVANSGGYSFQEDHDYETTVYIFDAEKMKKTGEVDTGKPNLYGRISLADRYLCINSAGNYYDVAGCGIILDCEKALKNEEKAFAVIPYVVTYNCTADNSTFYAIGSEYSFTAGGYEYTCLTLNASEILSSGGKDGYSLSLPGTMKQDVEKMESPYGIYVNPYTQMIYATDAGSYGSSGKLYQWSAKGELKGSYAAYINPGWFLALCPDSQLNGIDEIEAEEGVALPGSAIYDLLGRKVKTPVSGGIYIREGKKFIQK